MEKAPCGPRSILEFFVFECSIKYCLNEGIDATPNNVRIIYNTAAELFDTFDDELPIATKNIEEVEQFLREHEHTVDVFKALCLAQIRAQYSEQQ